MREPTLLPKARTADLVINDLTDEVLVYDLKRDKAHCLNPTAAAVWKLCDGKSSAAEIAGRLFSQTADGSRQTADGRSSRQEQDNEQDRGSSSTVREGSGLSQHHRLKSVPHEQMVWLALEQLSRDHLLEERLSWPASVPRLTRREALRRLGLGAAIAVPLIVSISAPPPAAAGTCKAKNANCSTGSECCSKACVANKCA
jgi:hypothetical protein